MPVRLHITDLISRLRFMLNAYTYDDWHTQLPKPKSDITLRFFKNRIANSRINLLSRYHFTILRLKFTKWRSNLLSRDRNLLSRDRIYCFKIEIYYVEIKLTKSRSNLLCRDRNLISRDGIF